MRLAVLVLAMLATSAAAQTSTPGDARLDAAIAQSVARLPLFDAAVARDDKAMLAVRVPYGEGRSELVWLGAVRRNADGSYEGLVLDPVAHAGLMQGSLYHARRDQVADWIYEDEKGDHGGLTVKLAREREPRHVDGFHFAD